MSFLKRAPAPPTSPIGTSFSTIPSPLQAIQCITKNEAQNAQGSTNGSSFQEPESHHPQLHQIPNPSSRRPEAAPPIPEIGFDSQNPTRQLAKDGPQQTCAKNAQQCINGGPFFPIRKAPFPQPASFRRIASTRRNRKLATRQLTRNSRSVHKNAQTEAPPPPPFSG